MKRWLSVMLICLGMFLLVGCAKQNTPQKKIDVFYCAADGGLESGSALVRYTALVAPDADLLHEALSLLNDVPAEAGGVVSALSGIRITTYSIQDGELRVVLSKGYRNLSELQKTLARSCLILTLCGLEEVETLSILEDDVLLESGLTRAILLSDSLPEGTGVVETTLWLPDLKNACLNDKTVQVDLSIWMNPAEGILSGLFGTPEIQSCLRHPVRLRTLAVEKGLCTLDFEESLLDAEPVNAAAERLFLFSIIDSLTERSDIDRIRFLCDGKVIERWQYMDLSGEFQRETGFTKKEMNSESNQIITLYLGSGTDAIVPIKLAVSRNGEEEPIGQTVSALLELKELWGYRRLIPASTTLLSWEMDGNTCVLHLSDDFHHSMYGEDLAAAAIANTLMDSCNLQGVSIFTESSSYQNGKTIEKDREWLVD